MRKLMAGNRIAHPFGKSMIPSAREHMREYMELSTGPSLASVYRGTEQKAGVLNAVPPAVNTAGPPIVFHIAALLRERSG
jgi:hypothetical protein